MPSLCHCCHILRNAILGPEGNQPIRVGFSDSMGHRPSTFGRWEAFAAAMSMTAGASGGPCYAPVTIGRIVSVHFRVLLHAQTTGKPT